MPLPSIWEVQVRQMQNLPSPMKPVFERLQIYTAPDIHHGRLIPFDAMAAMLALQEAANQLRKSATPTSASPLCLR
jgi:hypothetical protein